MIRKALKDDLDGLLRLYMQLHDNPMPKKRMNFCRFWTVFVVLLILTVNFLMSCFI